MKEWSRQPLDPVEVARRAALAREHGITEAARRLGVKPPSLYALLQRKGLLPPKESRRRQKSSQATPRRERIASVSALDELAIAVAASPGDRAAADRLLEACAAGVRGLIGRRFKRHADELLPAAMGGCWEAAQKYDPRFGGFWNYAQRLALGRAKDEARKLDSLSRRDRQRLQAAEHAGEATDGLRRPPRSLSQLLAKSDARELYLEDVLADPAAKQFHRNYAYEQLVRRLTSQLTLDEVLAVWLHLKHGVPMHEIARLLGVVETRVCQIVGGALRSLRDRWQGRRDEVFDDFRAAGS